MHVRLGVLSTPTLDAEALSKARSGVPARQGPKFQVSVAD
jgi:hypothetical protein